MPDCCDPPNRPSPEVIDRLIDAVAWAKTCMIVTAATPPGSADRAVELAKLRVAVAGPRREADEILAGGQLLPKLEAGAVLRKEASP